MTDYVTKPCKQCGAIMQDVYHQRVYCPDCAYKRTQDNRRMSQQNQATAKRKPRKGVGKRNTIAAVDRKADKVGLSYGKYVVMMNGGTE